MGNQKTKLHTKVWADDKSNITESTAKAGSSSITEQLNATDVENLQNEWLEKKKIEKAKEKVNRKKVLARRYKALRELCKDKNNKPMKLETFAALTKIPKQNIESFEDQNNPRELSRSNAQSYRKAIRENRGLDVSYEYLFGESDTMDVRYHNLHTYTGLSQHALEKLHDIQDETGGAVSTLINLLLENDLSLVVNIANFLLFEPVGTVESKCLTYSKNKRGEYYEVEYPLHIPPDYQNKALLLSIYEELLEMKEKHIAEVKKAYAERDD